jgi:hypothetical protein
MVAMSDPLNMEAIAHARFCAHMAIMPAMALRDEVEQALRVVYDDEVIPYLSRPKKRASQRSAVPA